MRAALQECGKIRINALLVVRIEQKSFTGLVLAIFIIVSPHLSIHLTAHVYENASATATATATAAMMVSAINLFLVL